MISLQTKIENVPKISRRIIPALKHLGIKTIRDLLFHFPARYEDFSKVKTIREIKVGETVTIRGKIVKATNRRTQRKRMVLTEAVINDGTGIIKALWFNQPFLARTLKVGARFSFSGKTAVGPGGVYLQNPAYEKITNHKSQITNKFQVPNTKYQIHTGGLVAVYPETRGISSRWIRYLVKTFMDLSVGLPDPLPPETRRKYLLPEIKEALREIHFPSSLDAAERARRRFYFEELLLLQLRALRERLKLKQHQAPAIPTDISLMKEFVRSLPFELTNAQRRSIWEILQDIAKPRPMNRLLEGDVGSGKTVVAAAAALLTVKAGYKVVFMAPTEILARQHYDTLSRLLKPFNLRVGLLMGAEKRIEDDPEVVVGTHALIQQGVLFENLGLVVVDEQHRFGVEQRAALLRNPNDAKTSELPERNYKIIERELSYKLGGIFFEIQRELGRYGRERQYSDAVEKKLIEHDIPFRREHPIEVAGRKSNFADFIVANKILIEVKAVPYIRKEDYYQTLRYLKTAKLELGLIVNFRQEYLKPKRILNPDFSGNSDAFGYWGRVIPHFLSMSATPIPRTLALTIYGDLDLSLLDEMPKDRKPVLTKIVEPGKREEAYDFIREEVKRGRQVFVICPRIEISNPKSQIPNKSEIPNSKFQIPNKSQIPNPKFQNTLLTADVKAVKEEYKKLSEEIFKDLRVGMLHGKMKPKEKDAVMKKFKAGEIDILVSTSVVEVGVDIPNATIMMIEGAERFGLAQLHQFRGRVGRGGEQSYCFLFPSEDGLVTKRLRAVVDAKNGFELAEKDLEIRGPGDIFGTRQWGVSGEIMKAVMDAKLVREVRREAVELLQKDPEFKNYPALRGRLEEVEEKIHLE